MPATVILQLKPGLSVSILIPKISYVCYNIILYTINVVFKLILIWLTPVATLNR